MFRKTLLILSLAFAAACGGSSEYIVTGTANANGADGIITVEKLEGNNLVNIEVTNLPPPDRIAPGTAVFAVWFKGEGRDAVQQGLLEYDADSRTGTLSATTVLSAFDVLVSAEADGSANSPSDTLVIEQTVSAP